MAFISAGFSSARNCERKRIRVCTRCEDKKNLGVFDERFDKAMAPRGKPGCEQCDGNGSISCAVCDGKGVFTMEMMGQVSSCQCRMCSGRKKIPCPSCKRLIYESVIWWDVWKKMDEEEAKKEEESEEGEESEGSDEDAGDDGKDGDDGDDNMPKVRWSAPPYVN